MSIDTESESSEGMVGSNGAGWLAALVGLWVVIASFVWGITGSGGGWWGGSGTWLYWSNIISGIIVVIFVQSSLHASDPQTGWLAVLVGLWILIAPFFWGLVVGGGINWWTASGVWLYWSNVISGLVIAILAAYYAQSRAAGSESSAAT